MTARLLFLVASSAAFAATTTPGPEKPAAPVAAPVPAQASPVPAPAPTAPPTAATTPATPAATPSAVPQRLPEVRYEKLRSNSPFAVATAAEAPKEDVIPWAQNLYVGSVAKMKEDGTEKDWVVIKDRTQPGGLIQLFGNEVNQEGYQLVKLEWSEEPRKTKASVKKGTEFATIEFDQAAFTSSAPAPQPSGQKPPQGVPRTQGALPGMPGVPIQPGANAIRPPTAGATIGRPSTPPGMRPPVSIPRPTNLPPAINQPAMPQNPAMAPGGANTNTRQRIRVIPSNP